MNDRNPADPGLDHDEVLPPTWIDSARVVPRAFVQPALRYMRLEAAGGAVMLVAALAAVAWANSTWGDAYFRILDTRIEIAFGEFHFHHLSDLTVREWINDALMVVFFFVVGLEIKRELVVGELRDPKAAALPAFAAVGGMLMPAGIYAVFNAGSEGSVGWGIPMATDIAFAIGVVALAGRRVPIGAKLFLLALAIVDDLGAILVIAVFYTSDLAFGWLAVAAAGLVLMAILNRNDIRSIWVYLAIGLGVWLAVLESGVHATIAGVATALLTPVASFYDPGQFAPRARAIVDRVEQYVPANQRLDPSDHHTIDRVQSLLDDLRRLSYDSLPPLVRLEHALSRYAIYLVVPLFAFANAGFVVSGDAIAGAVDDPVLMGIFLGLLLGKVVGVTSFAWLAVRLGLGRLPMRTTWRHMTGIGLLAGIGFTVSLFVSALSFPPGSTLADSARIGIFGASIVAGLAGFAFLRTGPPLDEQHPA